MQNAASVEESQHDWNGWVSLDIAQSWRSPPLTGHEKRKPSTPYTLVNTTTIYTMDTQDFLTLLFDAIALLFIVIVTLDFITFASIAISRQKPSAVSPVKDENEQQPNVIDMAHSKSTFSPISETTAPVNNLLQGIEIEKLQLRPARKIAKALNIAQKVHGKDAPVSWLRSQIKARLKDQPVQTAEVISSILQQAS